jgi:hypothetical protein
MPLPKFWVKFSGGVFLLLGKQIRWWHIENTTKSGNLICQKKQIDNHLDEPFSQFSFYVVQVGAGCMQPCNIIAI